MTLSELMSLKGRSALVTGACGHIGQVICETLLELGAQVISVDRPGTVCDFACDLEVQEQREELSHWASSKYPKLSILVNNAAFVGTSELEGWAVSFEKQTVDTWRRVLEVNLTAVFDLCKGLAPVLREAPGANIINIGSLYAGLGPDWRLYEDTNMGNPAAYAASKGGLVQLTRWLATTMAPVVRVNAISPGGVLRGQPEAFIKRYEARVPLDRMATEQDFKGAIAYLASDLSAYVTGQNICVDGGYGVW